MILEKEPSFGAMKTERLELIYLSMIQWILVNFYPNSYQSLFLFNFPFPKWKPQVSIQVHITCIKGYNFKILYDLQKDTKFYI